jgi:signal transduction histidine kinase
LDTAEVGNGLSDLRFEQTELIDIVLQARDSVEAMSEAGNVRLEFEADCIKCGIEVDRQRFYQAIRQIFAETVRRSLPGEAVTIEADTSNDDVVITFSCMVRPQGKDVTPCMSYRPDLSGVMIRDGSGARHIDPDMTIARTVLKLHGGAVKIDNDFEHSLKIVVTLPKAQKAF